MNIDKIYLINLERSKDRLEHFMNEVEKHKFPKDKLKIFKAIDAKTYEFTNDELELLKNMIHKNEIKTVLCNFLSHYYVWKDIIENKYENCLILQDDVYFKEGVVNEIDKIIENFPNDAKVVFIGLHLFASLSIFVDYPLYNNNLENNYCKEKINDYVCKLNDEVNPCSLAYLVKTSRINDFFENFKLNIGAIYEFIFNKKRYILL